VGSSGWYVDLLQPAVQSIGAAAGVYGDGSSAELPPGVIDMDSDVAAATNHQQRG